MKKLQTLKEIRDFKIDSDGTKSYYKADRDINFFYRDIQEAAKEWIKEIQDNPEAGYEASYGGDYNNITDWIKHFFNLEES